MDAVKLSMYRNLTAAAAGVATPATTYAVEYGGRSNIVY